MPMEYMLQLLYHNSKKGWLSMSFIKIPVRELNFYHSRSSGSGGQNINKVNTKVTLHWNIKKTKACSREIIDRFCAKYSTKIKNKETVIITSQRFRSQARNYADCVEKLHEMLQAVAIRPKTRKATRPTKESVQKRLGDKKRRSETKESRKKFKYTNRDSLEK